LSISLPACLSEIQQIQDKVLRGSHPVASVGQIQSRLSEIDRFSKINSFSLIFQRFLFIRFAIFPIFREREGISREKHDARVLKVDSFQDLLRHHESCHESSSFLPFLQGYYESE
jgi:hypothetical protein